MQYGMNPEIDEKKLKTIFLSFKKYEKKEK